MSAVAGPSTPTPSPQKQPQPPSRPRPRLQPLCQSQAHVIDLTSDGDGEGSAQIPIVVDDDDGFVMTKWQSALQKHRRRQRERERDGQTRLTGRSSFIIIDDDDDEVADYGVNQLRSTRDSDFEIRPTLNQPSPTVLVPTVTQTSDVVRRGLTETLHTPTPSSTPTPVPFSSRIPYTREESTLRVASSRVKGTLMENTRVVGQVDDNNGNESRGSHVETEVEILSGPSISMAHLRLFQKCDGSPRPGFSSPHVPPLPIPTLYNSQLPTPGPSESSLRSEDETPKATEIVVEPRRPATPPCYEVSEYGYKGQGLKALINIKPGMVIIKERPFITFQHTVLPDEIRKRYNALSSTKQRLFMSFRGVHEDDELDLNPDERLVDIAETNSLPLPFKNSSDEDDEDGREWGGICEHICRVNHSCVPNAGWKWDPDQKVMSLVAYLDIRAGDEITACYLDSGLLHSKRASDLKEKWKITCDCRACLTGNNRTESDRRRRTYHHRKHFWPDLDQGEQSLSDMEIFAFDRARAIENLGSARRMLFEEDQTALLSEVWEMEAAVHASWGDKEKTMKAAKMAKFYYYVTDGKKAAKNSAVAGWAADPKECEFWSLMLRENDARKRTKSRKRKWW